MSRDDLSSLWHQLPTERAGPGFASSVLARLDAPRRRRRGSRAAGLVVALLVVIGGGVGLWREHDRTQRRSELAVVRQEHARLSAELRHLRQLQAESSPLFYLGGTEGYAVFLDPAGGSAAPAESRGPQSAAWRKP